MRSEDWVRGRMLGSDSFGKVYIAIDRSTGEQFAVKSAGGEECSSLRRNARDVEALENEILILQQLECPQVCAKPADDSLLSSFAESSLATDRHCVSIPRVLTVRSGPYFGRS